ncbi:MAG: hypothetical protein K8J09_07385, partial [Planctomycetes bacterium]|nr:hypothetical protein [Planctomycetota bacterium]
STPPRTWASAAAKSFTTTSGRDAGRGPGPEVAGWLGRELASGRGTDTFGSVPGWPGGSEV